MGDFKLYDEKEDGTNYTIVGDKKMGKTTLLKTLIKILKKHDTAVICYDRLMQFNGTLPCYENVSQVPNGHLRQFCIMADSVENFVLIAEEFRKQEFREGRKLIVIFDELDTIYDRYGPMTDDSATKTHLTEWIDYSRHKKLEMWGCVRRPQKIWQHYLEQSGRIFLFRTSGNLARKKLADVIGSSHMVKAIGRLPPHEYLVYPDEMEKFESVKGNKSEFSDETQKE